MSDGYATKVRPEKVQAVDRIMAELRETQAVVLTEYRGLTVNELADLRTKLKGEETTYRVVKNTLARRAASDLGFGDLVELFVGPVALAYCKGDPIAAAKVLATFAREHPDLVIKGGVLEGRVLSADETKGLATIDSIDVSRAKIAGMLTAPLRQLMMLLEAPAGRIIYVLDHLGARAPEEPAPEASTDSSTPEEAPDAEAQPEEAPGDQTPSAEAAEPGQTEVDTKEGE